MINKALFTSKKGDYETPDDLFAALDREFHFTLDAAASADNAKCAKYYTIEDNALQQDWPGVVWLNPPYGRGIGDWIAKAVEESRKGATVVCLLPARTDTKWFHRYVKPNASEIRFLEGRITFKGTPTAAPFPSVVVVFVPWKQRYTAG